MHYIHLTNDTYVISTSKGIFSFSPNSFNFNKVKNLIKQNCDEKDILPLTEPPSLTNGLYKAYLTPKDTLVYTHFIDEVTFNTYDLKNDIIDLPKHSTFLGIYTSKQELIEDWPEYLI